MEIIPVVVAIGICVVCGIKLFKMLHKSTQLEAKRRSLFEACTK